MRTSDSIYGVTSWRGLLYTAGGMLCAINLIIFLLLHLVAALSHFGLLPVDAAVNLLYLLQLPASATDLLSRPWTLLTYMFVQYEFSHLLMNILWLWAFAFIIERSGVSLRRVVAIYIAGGLAGALAYILFAPSSAPGLVGASASITSLMGWILIAIPSQKVRLWLFGEVSLWVVVLFVLLIFILGGRSISWGGHAAHLAGLAAGCSFGLYDRMRSVGRLFRRRGRGANRSSRVDSMTLDDILDKVRRSGYGSLTRAERQRLFQVSSKSTDNQS